MESSGVTKSSWDIIENLLAEIEAFKDIAESTLIDITYKEFKTNFTDILLSNGWNLGKEGDIHIINSKYRARVLFNHGLKSFKLEIETPVEGIKEYKFNIYLDGRS